MAISVANFTSDNFCNRHSADLPTAPMNDCYGPSPRYGLIAATSAFRNKTAIQRASHFASE